MAALQSPRPSHDGSSYHQVLTPQSAPSKAHALPGNAPSESLLTAGMRVNRVLYTSVALLVLQPLQFGWSTGQLNFSKFHNQDDCDVRPVADGTCLMFTGHTSTQWLWVMNLWIVGGMVGALGSARLADHFGRKRTSMANALLMILGAVVQASAPSLSVFAFGRFLAGLASGVCTTLCNGYVNELAPPHLRNRLGVYFQVATCSGIMLAGFSFFAFNRPNGWRFVASFPMLLGVVILVASPRFLVESPSWLLAKNRRQEAEQAITRLFGADNVPLALAWMTSAHDQDLDPQSVVEMDKDVDVTQASTADSTNPWRQLFSPLYRRQTLVAVMLALTQQLSGINAVFFYSSSTFKDAGLSDDRVGSMIVNIVNVLPTFMAAGLGMRFGNRRMMILGHFSMLVFAACMTVSLLINSPVLSIVFTALYVAVFEVSLGPLVFVLVAAMFPSSLRASGTSLCLFANWCGSLAIGIGYPYVADALGDWGFLPFMVTLTGFGLFMIKFLPETAGKTDEEIQAIFFAKVARQ